MSINVLLTGGSGLIGQRLTHHLLQKGYEVSWLSRTGKSMEGVKGYKWNIKENTCDPEAIRKAGAIIHLAGENVASGRWDKEQKKKIIESRTLSTQLLLEAVQKIPNKIKVLVSASGAGYYGYDNGGIELVEKSRFGDDFLAKVVKEWEAVVDEFLSLGIRTVKLRTGMVLSEKGGALEKIAQPIKYYCGAPLGSGNQYISWIHIDDLCKMYVHCLENEKTEGAYNSASPNPITNKELTKTVAKTLGKPIFMPNVPAFILKLVLGEMSSLVLGSCRLNTNKIVRTGFGFDYAYIDNALENLLGNDDHIM